MTVKAAPFVGLALVVVLPVVSGPARADPDCYCTDRTGARVEMGVSVCLTVDDRSFVARCEMSQNVPMWRPTGETCALSSRARLERLHPAGDLGGVHAHISLAENKV